MTFLNKSKIKINPELNDTIVGHNNLGKEVRIPLKSISTLFNKANSGVTNNFMLSETTIGNGSFISNSLQPSSITTLKFNNTDKNSGILLDYFKLLNENKEYVVLKINEIGFEVNAIFKISETVFNTDNTTTFTVSLFNSIERSDLVLGKEYTIGFYLEKSEANSKPKSFIDGLETDLSNIEAKRKEENNKISGSDEIDLSLLETVDKNSIKNAINENKTKTDVNEVSINSNTSSINSLSSGIQHSIPQTGNTPSNEPAPIVDGIYPVNAIGTFTHFGGLIISSLDNKKLEISVEQGQTVFKLILTPLNVSLASLAPFIDSVPTNGSSKLVDSNGVAVELYKKIYKDNIPYKRKNIIDTRVPSVNGGFYWNFGGNIEATTSTIAASEYVLLNPSTTYTLSGVLNGWRGVLFATGTETTGGELVTFTDVTGGKKFTTGTTKLYFSTNLIVTEGGGNIVAGHVQLEEGILVTSEEIYIDNINDGVLKTSQIAEDLETPSKTTVLNSEQIKKEIYETNIPFERENIIDPRPEAMQKGFYLNFAKNLEATTSPLTANIFKKLKPSTTYTLSGAVDSNWRAGLFTNEIDATGADSVIFTDVVNGKKFTTGTDKLYFAVNITTTLGGGDIVTGHIQLEEGEVVTSEKPYILNINGKFVDKTTLQKSQIVAVPTYNDIDEKLPLIYDKLNVRTSDVTVVTWGSSLSVREGNNTAFSNPQHRPPLCASNNFSWNVWDKVRFGYEKFFRFDADGYDANPRFTESGGVFVTVTPNIFNNLSHGIDNTVWDDFSQREGITRMYKGTANVAVTFSIEHTSIDKEGCCDFIYRTDLNGSQVNTFSVSEGYGKAYVVDENGNVLNDLQDHVISMRHGSIEAHRGNTRFNSKVRIKFITNTIDSRNQPKTITLTKTDTADTRFMYWGIQTSIERYMVSIVSSGRGGQDFITMTPFTDDDIFDHKPDLLISEIPINGGINTPNNTELPIYYSNQVYEWFFDLTNPRSIKSKSNSWGDFNLLLWSPGTTENVFLTDDIFKTYQLSDGNFYGIQDNWRRISIKVRDNKENGFFFVNMFENLLHESKELYGNYKAGFTESSITSNASFVGDSIHYNDFTMLLFNKWLLSVFKK